MRWKAEQENDSNKLKINGKLKNTAALVKVLSFLSHLQNTRRGEITVSRKPMLYFSIGPNIEKSPAPRSTPDLEWGGGVCKTKVLDYFVGGRKEGVSPN